MTDIILIGTGQLARHLFQAFKTVPDIRIKQVAGRSSKALEFFSKGTETSLLPHVDKGASMYIIAISDDFISSVSQSLNLKNELLVHTSGISPMKALPAQNRRGVWYPVQSFSAGRKLDYRQIPVCLETEFPEDMPLLRSLAAAVSDQLFEMGGQQRAALHLGAVLANNFTNHLYTMAQEVLEQAGLHFDILAPLLRETTEKALALDARNAQTGPAKRGNTAGMQAHLSLLKKEEYKTLYRNFSQSIQTTHAEEL